MGIQNHRRVVKINSTFLKYFFRTDVTADPCKKCCKFLYTRLSVYVFIVFEGLSKINVNRKYFAIKTNKWKELVMCAIYLVLSFSAFVTFVINLIYILYAVHVLYWSLISSFVKPQSDLIYNGSCYNKLFSNLDSCGKMYLIFRLLIWGKWCWRIIVHTHVLPLLFFWGGGDLGQPVTLFQSEHACIHTPTCQKWF